MFNPELVSGFCLTFKPWRRWIVLDVFITLSFSSPCWILKKFQVWVIQKIPVESFLLVGIMNVETGQNLSNRLQRLCGKGSASLKMFCMPREGDKHTIFTCIARPSFKNLITIQVLNLYGQLVLTWLRLGRWKKLLLFCHGMRNPKSPLFKNCCSSPLSFLKVL